MEAHPINIWDDYYDDGYVPEGEIQETYAYVEKLKLEQGQQEVCLKHLMQFITQENMLPKTVEMTVVYYDSATKYPNLVGTEAASLLYRRWELKFKHLSHALREDLVKKLQTDPIANKHFVVYSES